MTAQQRHDPRRGESSTPGLESREAHGSFRGYIIGYVSAIALTIAAFAIAPSTSMAPFSVAAALAVLAIAQMLIHLIFFLHINTAPMQKTNILAFAAAMLIIAIVVIGSIWIMGHLNRNMLPMDHLMQMQR
ncbi:MAG TPA: cytochrome o ubiquinol oxidase subunit IV [Pinirhizobacter sp.]|uniref:cytochrome o ubiquinol oxidase subunit IV n=1 Tax=Pinirhizobacter sp. TaxID=2950432 RepID=UPI002CC77E8E|nr:cytochrome o ubiquinol oxidase subunit IV [Pinirhizobacter sp.]HMH69264.1 cytochrome o ubiquinol oxidase subunit IV [Pinirhizobacter sp.]